MAVDGRLVVVAALLPLPLRNLLPRRTAPEGAVPGRIGDRRRGEETEDEANDSRGDRGLPR